MKKTQAQQISKRRISDCNEINLFVGILREAWVDALKPQKNKKKMEYYDIHSQKDRKEAIFFMEETQNEWNESFEIICNLIGIETEEFRNGYL